MIKVTVGGQDVVLDLSRTLAQSVIRAGETLVLKSAGLLGGMQLPCMLQGAPLDLEHQLASAAAAAAPATTVSASVGFLQVRELSWRESARAIKRQGREGERYCCLLLLSLASVPFLPPSASSPPSFF
jgi:hypothetical protein